MAFGRSEVVSYLRSAPARIAVAYATLFSLSVLVLFAVVYWAAAREMTAELEASIEQDVRPLMEAYRQGRTFRLVQAVQERVDAAEGSDVVYLLQSASRRPVAGNLAPTPPFEGWRTLRLLWHGQNKAVRISVLARGVRLNGNFLLVGRNTEALANLRDALRRAYAWSLIVTVVLALVGAVLMRRSSMRRVEAISGTTEQIVAGNLSCRAPVLGTDDDFDRLSLNINRMLDRIQELMESLRQVSNDIAHDLRTPLARLRQRLETIRRQKSSVHDYERAIDGAIDETNAIIETFNSLLRIAQIEAGARRAQFTAVDLSAVAGTIVDVYESVAEEEGQELGAEIETDVRVLGDRDLLTQALANVVENSIRHTPAGTIIRVSVAAAQDAGGCRLEVADNGPGVPAGERESVLRRFYRLDASRTTPGSGLGLSLVRAVADLHDARIQLLNNAPGLRVVLTFPARAPAQAPQTAPASSTTAESRAPAGDVAAG